MIQFSKFSELSYFFHFIENKQENNDNLYKSTMNHLYYSLLSKSKQGKRPQKLAKNLKKAIFSMEKMRNEENFVIHLEQLFVRKREGIQPNYKSVKWI